MRLSVLLAILPAVLAAPAKRSEPAPLLIPRTDESTSLIADKYIVKFKDDSSLSILESAMSILSEAPEHVYSNTLQGFSAKLDAETLEALRDHPDVDYIEQDATVQLEAYVSQTGAPWGLANLSSRTTGGTTYTYDNSAGTGTCSYIIDTGIDTTHSNFGGRASWAANFVDSSNTDGNGHGTHVAGTVGSTTYGVAKLTKLYAVKVLNSAGSGTLAGVIAGIDAVPGHAATQSCPNGVVANMSLGASYSAAVNTASTNLIASGVFLAVAAGNSNANASNYSPASTPNACTVGATTSTNAKASFSNYGAIVDIFAPGNAILSTWPGGSTNSISGTSMASPHIAGLGAYLAAFEGIDDPVALCNRIVALAKTGVITGLPSGTPNRLAFNGNPSA